LTPWSCGGGVPEGEPGRPRLVRRGAGAVLSWVGTPVLYGVSETKPVALAGHGGAVPRLALEMSVWAAGLFVASRMV
jgi:hypothetical protein